MGLKSDRASKTADIKMAPPVKAGPFLLDQWIFHKISCRIKFGKTLIE
jgi:hypothetical protein